MMRYVLIVIALTLAACSSSGGGSVSKKPIGELRAACQKGDRGSCNAIRAHDGML